MRTRLCFVGLRAERLEQDQLLDPRHGRSGLFAERAGYDRDLAPPSEADALRGAGSFDRIAGGVLAEEDHCQAAPGRGNECTRNRQQDSCAVSRPPVGSDGPAVAEGPEPLQHAVEDCARGVPGRIGEKADPAGVALATQVVDRRMHRVRPFV